MPDSAPATEPAASWLPIALAGLCASLIGLGIGRFAYVPLLPLMIDSHWTSVAGAAQIAAANLVGYLLGGATAHRIALWRGAGPAIRGSMLAILLSLVACSLPAGVLWLWIWRMIAGAAGGILMILAAPYLMRQIAPRSRGKAIGIVFSGIGIGIVFSGLAVPAIGGDNLGAAWLLLAAFVLPALLYAWPKFGNPPVAESHAAAPQPLWPRGALLALLCAYVLDAIGYLPHTVFWVEYLVHDLGMPLAIGGAFWAVFGAGAAIGPLLTGMAADRFGFRNTLVACFACKAMMVTLPLWSTSMPALFISSFVVGALTPGMVAVASGRAVELGGVAAHQRNWAMMTFLYALVQAVAGYAMAAVYAATHSFTLLFSVAGAVLLLAAVIASVGRTTIAAVSD